MPLGTSQDVDITELEMAFAKDPASDAFLSLSEAYLGQGRFMEAMVVCKKGIKSKPDSSPGRLLLCRIYSQQGKTPKALGEVSTLLEADPENVEALVFKGKLLDTDGQPEEAIELYKKAIDLQGDNEEAKQALADKGIDYAPAAPEPPPPPVQAPVQQGAQQAIQPGAQVAPSTPPQAAAVSPTSSQPAMAAQPATSSQPAMPKVYDGSTFNPNQGLKETKRSGPGITLGIISVCLVMLAILLGVSILHYRDVRKIDDLNTKALKHVRADSAKALEEAIDKLDEVLKLDEDQELALGLRAYALGVRVFDHGIRDSKDDFATALKAAKEGSDTSWRWAAQITNHLAAADSEGAEKLALDKTKEGYATVQTFVGLAQAATANGNLKGAQQALKTAREKGPTSVRAFVASGELYRRMLQIKLARAQYDAALKTEPGHAMALVGRSMLALENPTQFAIQSAGRDWENIRDLGKNNIGPRIWGRAKAMDALFNHLLGKASKAKEKLKEAESIAPTDADVFYVSGRVKMMMKDTAGAIEAFKKSSSLDPHKISTWVWLARAYTETGKKPEAEKALSKARKLDSGNVQILVAEASNKRRDRKYAEAESLLKQAEKENPNNVTIALELLETYKSSRDFDKAYKQMTAIEKDHSGSKTVMTKALVIFGQSLLYKKDTVKAVSMFEAAIKMDPNNADAYFFLCYAQSGDKAAKTKAYAACKKYLELAPNGKYKDRAKKLLEKLE